MFKSLDKKQKILLLIIFSSNILLFPVFWNFWKVGGSFSLDSIRKSISRLQAESEEYARNKYFQDEKVQPFLFSKHLNDQKLKGSSNISKALTNTTELLNTELNCELTEEDISIILLDTHPLFIQHYYDGIIHSRRKVEQPDSTSINKTCKILLNCQTPKNKINTLNIDKCKSEIYERFEQELVASTQNESIETASLGSNKYQNGNIHDAQYDLLHDISQIWKVLFESFRAAPEVIYYQAPLFNARNEYTEDQNWANPTNNTTPLKVNTTSSDTSTINNESSRTLIENPQDLKPISPPNNTNETAKIEFNDPEIEGFLKKNVETAYGNDQHLLFQNQCIPINSQKEKKSDINKVASPLGESANKNEVALKNLQDQFKNITSPKLPTIKENTRINTEDQNNNRENLATKLQDEEKKKNTCEEKCEAKDKNGEYHYASDERVVCKLQCFCGEYTSPALPNSEDVTAPILEEWALRIRFCTIPSELIIPDTSEKSIRSISEIIGGIFEVNKALYNGGKLSVQKIAKEALDSKHIGDFSIADSMSFNLNLSTKTNPKIPTKTDQENKNKLFLDQVKENTTPITRNTFVILAWGNKNENTKNSVKNPDVPKVPQSANTTIQDQTNSLSTALYTQNIASQGIILSERIELNHKFLNAINKELETNDNQVKGLFNKK